MPIADRQFFERVYGKAKSADMLPWHRTNPPTLLERAVRDGKKATGRALDIGCGSGVFSVYLARAGYRVTSLDFAEGAIHLAKRTAGEAGVELNAVRADVLTWTTSDRFDVILDSGCLHGFRGEERERYRDKIVSWLDDHGDFVLVHFDRMHRLDWRPIGPRRIPRAQILALFSPALAEKTHTTEDLTTPLPIGPTVRIGTYWFRHNRV
jgi:SAM-dependent methyltransferase